MKLVKPNGNYEKRKAFKPNPDDLFIQRTQGDKGYGNWSLCDWTGRKQGKFSLHMWNKAYPHFTWQEVACRKTGILRVSVEMMDNLELLRTANGKTPLQVRSCYRTIEHNKAVGGASNSAHIFSVGVDIGMGNVNAGKFYNLAVEKFGFTGVGFYYDDDFLHLDRMDRWEWNDGINDKAKMLAGSNERFSVEKKTRSQKKKETQKISAMAVMGSSPALINSIAGFDLPQWFIMGAIVLGAVGGLIYWWKNRE